MQKELRPIEVVQTTFRVINKYGHIWRDEKRVSRFIACNVASEYRSSSQLLKLFFNRNPMGRVLGYKHLPSHEFQDGDIYAYGMCGGFGIFLYEDTTSNHHDVILKVSSPVDNKWYIIGAGRVTVELEYFRKQPSKAKLAIEQMTRLRQFSLTVNNEEVSVPWS